MHAGVLCDKDSAHSAVYLCRILLNIGTDMSAEFEEKHTAAFINFQQHVPRIQGENKVTILHFDSKT